MNIFDEFLRVIQHLQKEGIEYALIGGVAVAFHTEPRFTKDIDLLIREGELDRMAEVLKREGYFRSSTPWTFKDSNVTLHRFMRVEHQDEMVVDVLVAGDERHGQIIANALEAESENAGNVRVASKPDLIWLKRQRNSKQDEADIARLEHEKS
ncbi:MAG: nucleotidyltransferase [bacterium]